MKAQRAYNMQVMYMYCKIYLPTVHKYFIVVQIKRKNENLFD